MDINRAAEEHEWVATGREFTCPLRRRMRMSTNVSKGSVLLAGVTTAAAAVFVVGHMFALDWVGKKVREYVRAA